MLLLGELLLSLSKLGTFEFRTLHWAWTGQINSNLIQLSIWILECLLNSLVLLGKNAAKASFDSILDWCSSAVEQERRSNFDVFDPRSIINASKVLRSLVCFQQLQPVLESFKQLRRDFYLHPRNKPWSTDWEHLEVGWRIIWRSYDALRLEDPYLCRRSFEFESTAAHQSNVWMGLSTNLDDVLNLF